MKRIALTLAIVLGISIGAMAQGGGLFGKGPQRESIDYYDNYGTRDGMLGLPSSHGSTNDVDGVPLGSGALLLIGFGAAYALKRRKK